MNTHFIPEAPDMEDNSSPEEVPFKGGRVLGFFSGKGGVGKSTVAVNLAFALALLGKKVVIIDTDTGLRCQDVLLGVESRVIFTLLDVVEGKCTLSQALIRNVRMKNVSLLTVPANRDSSSLTDEEFVKIVAELSRDHDFVLIDAPAGIDSGFKISLAATIEPVIVTNPDPVALRGADRVAGIIENQQMKPPVMIINRLRADLVKRGRMPGIPEILDAVSIKLSGIIPEDSEVIVSSCTGSPVVLDEASWAGAAFRELARHIEGDEISRAGTVANSPGKPAKTKNMLKFERVISKIKKFWS